jgi:hypothetical protein
MLEANDVAELQKQCEVLRSALDVISSEKVQGVYPSTPFSFNVTRKFLREAVAALEDRISPPRGRGGAYNARLY